MYRLMGLEGLSASRKSSCATMEAERTSSTSPFRQIMRSFSRREKMSEVWMPPETVSVTKGMGNALCGGREGVALWVDGKGWKVDMLRKWVVGRRVRAIEGRSARRVDLVMGSMVRLLCVLDVVVGEWEVDGCVSMY